MDNFFRRVARNENLFKDTRFKKPSLLNRIFRRVKE